MSKLTELYLPLAGFADLAAMRQRLMRLERGQEEIDTNIPRTREEQLQLLTLAFFFAAGPHSWEMIDYLFINQQKDTLEAMLEHSQEMVTLATDNADKWFYESCGKLVTHLLNHTFEGAITSFQKVYFEAIEALPAEMLETDKQTNRALLYSLVIWLETRLKFGFENTPETDE